MQTEAGASLTPPEPPPGPTPGSTPRPTPGLHSASSPHSERAPGAVTAPPRRRRLLPILALVCVVVYVLDQLTKAWAMAHLSLEVSRPLVGTLLQLHLTRNAGAAFSIATGATWVLTLVACAVVVVIVRASRRLGSAGWAVALGLLLGGSLGNLTDRMVREPAVGRGHVVDFLQLPHWPIFNVADSSIVSAAVLIGLLALRGVNLDGTRTGAPSSRGGAGAVSEPGRG